MREDKITAMWEEDGDLMRIKDFFAYVYQDNNLKDRIKNKTLEKIADLNEPQHNESSVNTQHFTEKENVSSQMSNNKLKTKNFLTSIKTAMKNKKNVVKVLSAAAVVIFAVYLGSTGLLTNYDSPLRIGAASQKAAETQGANFTDGVMPMAPSAMPAPQDTGVKLKGEMSAADSAFSSNQRNSMLPEERDVASGSGTGAIQQKIVYVLEASIKAEDVSAAVDAVEEKVKSLGGYVSESRQNNDKEYQSAYLTLKIPVTTFESFRGDLSQFGTVSNENLTTDDVTRQYFDVETRLRSWEAQEKRYLEILQQAKTVEDILRIEDSLANVRREMESLKGQLKYWDNRVDYSEVRLNIQSNKNNLTVNDPWQPVSFESTIKAAQNALIKSISFLWNGLNYILVVIGYAIPIIIILVVIWFIYRTVKRAKK